MLMNELENPVKKKQVRNILGLWIWSKILHFQQAPKGFQYYRSMEGHSLCGKVLQKMYNNNTIL